MTSEMMTSEMMTTKAYALRNTCPAFFIGVSKAKHLQIAEAFEAAAKLARKEGQAKRLVNSLKLMAANHRTSAK